MDVELYVDPSCPWSWAAYLWLDDVAARRQLRLRVRPFSLLLRDGTAGLSPLLCGVREEAHRALRVAASIPSGEVRNALYAAVTAPAYADIAAGRVPRFDVVAALAAVDCDPALAGKAGDATVDSHIADGMRSLAELLPVAEPSMQRIPVLVLHTARGPVGCNGPLLDPPPHGRQAVQLWDATEQLLQLPGVYGISRARPARHSLVASPRDHAPSAGATVSA